MERLVRCVSTSLVDILAVAATVRHHSAPVLARHLFCRVSGESSSFRIVGTPWVASKHEGR